MVCHIFKTCLQLTKQNNKRENGIYQGKGKMVAVARDNNFEGQKENLKNQEFDSFNLDNNKMNS